MKWLGECTPDAASERAVMKGEPAARCATKDESPLTSVRGRGHSSHLVCRTSGFLLLRPPPPSPSRLHGGFLLLPLQKATGPEWRAKRWQLECFLALSFTLTLILLQCNPLYLLLPMSTPCLPFSPHTSSAIQLLPLFFFSFFSKSIIFHTPFHPSMALSRPFLLCKASLSPLLSSSSSVFLLLS